MKNVSFCAYQSEIRSNYGVLYFCKNGDTTIEEVTGLKLMIEPKGDDFAFTYKVTCASGTYCVSNNIELYASLDQFKNGEPIEKVSMRLSDALTRSDRQRSNILVHLHGENDVDLMGYKLMEDGCREVYFDVKQIEIDYFDNKWYNVSVKADFGKNEEFINNMADAKYYYNYKVIDKDGNETEHKPIIDHFRLSKEQENLVNEFMALVKKLNDNDVAIIYDSDCSDFVFVNKTGDEWESSYDRPESFKEELNISILRNVCPCDTIYTDWHTCDDSIYLK